jgi:Ca2+-transporting ATPase
LRARPSSVLGGQVLIAFVGGQAFSIVRINGRDWAISIIIGLMSIPLGFLIRLSPTAPFERFLIKCRLYPDPNKLPTISAEAEERDEYEYNEALTKVRDNLHTFARIRGGRIGSSPLVVSARRRKLKKANIHHSSILTMVPTLVAGTVGAGSGWANKVGESQGLENPAGFDPSRSSANLWRGKLTFYEPDVNSEVYMKYGPKQ